MRVPRPCTPYAGSRRGLALCAVFPDAPAAASMGAGRGQVGRVAHYNNFALGRTGSYLWPRGAAQL